MPGLAPGRHVEPVQTGGAPVGLVHRGQGVDPAPPQALLLLGRGLDHPALHGVGDVVRRHQSLDVLHGEEGHAQVLRVRLEVAQRGQRDRRPAVGQRLHDPVLGGELRVQEEEVLGRGDPDDQAALLAVAGAGAAEDGLVGEAVRRRRLDVEDLGPRSVVGLGREPPGQDAATSSGSRWSMSGTGRQSTESPVPPGSP